MARKAYTFRFPPVLIEEVDLLRGDVTRTRFIERVLEAAVGPVERHERIRSEAHALQVEGSEAAQGPNGDAHSPAPRERPASPRAPLPGKDALAETLAKLPNARVGPRRPRVGPRPRGKR